MRVRSGFVVLVSAVAAACPCQAAAAGPGNAELMALTESPYTSLPDFADRLAQLEQALKQQNDPRAIFVSMYVVLTESGAAAIDSGAFDDGEWVSAFIVAFGNLYRQAFYEFECGNLDLVPPAWIVAFDAAAANDITVFQHAYLGIHAHINRDVPYAVAEVTPLRDRARRFRDFARTNDFIVASINIVEDAVAAYDADLSALDMRLRHADERLLKQVLSRWRFRAWRRAETIAAMQPGPALDFYGAWLNELTRRHAVWARDSEELFALGDADGVAKLLLPRMLNLEPEASN